MFGCILPLLAPPASAQTTTVDGIRAALGGDYTAAVRILRPLADDPVRPDPVAQFFLATLYDTGQGPDTFRACGLFLRSARGAHPFAEQSAAIAEAMRKQLGDGASLCIAEERWQGGPPQSFDLGPGHRIVFADTSVRVTYGDKEQRSDIRLPPLAVFLPVRYVPLAVTRPASARRHFFQWFHWTPDAAMSPSSWSLGWTFSEVVGDQWIPIKWEKDLVVVSGTSPPVSYDPAKVVRLQLNPGGEAEVVILGGTSPRTETIPRQGGR